MSTLSLLRWISIIPCCVAAWYAGLLAGMAIYELGELTCPSQYIVSGTCFAPWIVWINNSAHVIGAGVAASLIVVLSYWLAPLHKIRIALAALVVGSLIATAMLIMTKAWLPYCSALTSGALAYLLIKRSKPSATTD